VYAATNFDIPHKINLVQRGKRQRLSIPRPNLISKYCRGMGGVDLHNHFVGAYRIGIRGKKWYWPFVTHFIDMSVSNAWVLHSMCGGGLSQLQFRRQLVLTYIGRNKASQIVRQPRVHQPPQDMRFDGMNHCILKRDQQRQCQHGSCSARPRTYCTKCNITLCVDCFTPYHTP
jgi:hypothetical protein